MNVISFRNRNCSSSYSNNRKVKEIVKNLKIFYFRIPLHWFVQSHIYFIAVFNAIY
jgi:hypothetical protein